MPAPVRPRNHGWRPLVLIVGIVFAAGFLALAVVLRSGETTAAPEKDCPDDSEVRAVQLLTAQGAAPPAQLEKSARILQERLSTYDCHADVTVKGNQLAVAARTTAMAHLDGLIAPGQLQLREVLEAAPASQCDARPRAVPAEAQTEACSTDRTETFRLAPAQVTSADVKTAKAQRDEQFGEWQVIISFTPGGQESFTALTGRLVGKRLAIVVDGVVISAPNINERIRSDAQISGSFTEASANALVDVLQHGALPLTFRRA